LANAFELSEKLPRILAAIWNEQKIADGVFGYFSLEPQVRVELFLCVIAHDRPDLEGRM
jgi:hypothetical protein